MGRWARETWNSASESCGDVLFWIDTLPPQILEARFFRWCCNDDQFDKATAVLQWLSSRHPGRQVWSIWRRRLGRVEFWMAWLFRYEESDLKCFIAREVISNDPRCFCLEINWRDGCRHSYEKGNRGQWYFWVDEYWTPVSHTQVFTEFQVTEWSSRFFQSLSDQANIFSPRCPCRALSRLSARCDTSIGLRFRFWGYRTGITAGIYRPLHQSSALSWSVDSLDLDVRQPQVTLQWHTQYSKYFPSRPSVGTALRNASLQVFPKLTDYAPRSSSRSFHSVRWKCEAGQLVIISRHERFGKERTVIDLSFSSVR